MWNLGAGLKAFFGLVVAAAAAGAVYIAPQFLEPREASVSEPAVKTEPGSAPGNATPQAVAPGAETKGSGEGDTEVASLSSDWVMPRFDVLRVEPDGSTVIAGKAEPGLTLQIVNGDTVIASTTVGPSGDFAAVLDTPLDAGDYQLKLRIVGADGAVRDSEEVATVSVPQDADGELLAMVSRPGEASRIIAQPSAAEPGPEAETAAVEPTPPSEDTAPDQGMVPQDAASAPSTPDLPEAASQTTDSAPGVTAETPAEPAREGSDTEIAAIPDASEPSEAVEPADPEASEADDAVAPEASRAADAAPPEPSGPGDAGAPEAADMAEAAVEAETPDSGETADAGTEIAAVSPNPAASDTTVEPAVGVTVRVDAIEIEGDRIFIAGSATPGYRVQVSADGTLIGAGEADDSGRYIIEAEAELAVGDHIVNADLIDKSTGTVLLRATVPFNRPEGEALAAVAPAPQASRKTSRVTAGDGAAPPAPAPDAAVGDPGVPGSATSESSLVVANIAELSQMREEAFEALAALEAMVADPGLADPVKVAAARRAAVDKLKAASVADLPADSTAEARAIARSMRAQARAALAVIAPETGAGGSANPDGAAPEGSEATQDLPGLREQLQQAQSALSEPADTALAADAQPEGGLPTIEQEPLASAPGAVIIRRGDTLWRISRRTYGQGVRYTTIYLANRSQIQNPDRIQPGQVFSVPETPLENAEDLHRERLEAERNR